MVDVDQLSEAMVLKRQVLNISSVLDLLEVGHGRVVGLIVAPQVEGETPSPDAVFPGSVMLRTDEIEFQTTWINGLKNQLRTRQTQIRTELRNMGVTGVA